MDLSSKSVEIAAKFEEKWGPFTRALAGHPKTALAIGFGAGVAIGTAAGRAVLSLMASLIF